MTSHRDPTNKKQANRVDTAIRSMLHREPFFAHIALGMKIREVTGDKDMPTTGTDGEYLWYNPDYFAKLTDQELEGVMAHETLHAAYRHPWRGEGLEHKIWNIACDIQVNRVLKNHRFILPPGADTVAPLGAYGMDSNGQPRAVEEIYNALMQQAKGGGGSNKGVLEAHAPSAGGVESPEGDNDKRDPEDEGDGEGDSDKPGDGKPKSGKAKGENMQGEYEAKKRLMAAAAEAKKRGKLPGDLEAIITEIGRGRKDWKESFRRFMLGGVIPDQTWARPNRRYISDGDYLPGNAKHGPGEIVICVDSSGSIDDALAAKFIAEVRKIHEDTQPEKTHIVVCDARVQWTGEYGPYDNVECVIRGRGGTDFVPCFDWVKAKGINCKVLIYFTDLYGRFPDAPPEYPVCWVVWPGGANAVPFGELLPMTD